ncbi:uncharacterized protein KGF55_005024 [Candida pseudojiufengensis]|uniref:uncharacterized protein n=1 Tax=Candida pseudojiufengensis TaxID=497109 RepID=UPI002225AB8F|nr:uncharacterized protein KGF55_005024 [Candida pseudojiufengensis]KAI5959792.1 hypothetical protein KGF55_005024 [Candida pseudojiufengensis]
MPSKQVTSTSTKNTIYDKFINFIQFYLCNIIHNPIISSIIIISYLYFQFINKIILKNNSSILNEPVEFEIEKDNFIWDILSTIINIIFILRFQINFNPIKFFSKFISKSKNIPTTRSSKYLITLILEISFFLIQIVSCVYLILNFINIIYSQKIKIFILLQISLPIFIFGLTFINNKSLLVCLKECNNNFLPFFISNSFLFINLKDLVNNEVDEVEFPKLVTTDNEFLNVDFIFKLANYSFKFYLIYQFIIYELNQIKNCEEEQEEEEEDQAIEGLKDEKLLSDNQCYEGCYESTTTTTSKTNKFNYISLKNYLMLVTCIFMILYDCFNIFYV